MCVEINLKIAICHFCKVETNIDLFEILMALQSLNLGISRMAWIGIPANVCHKVCLVSIQGSGGLPMFLRTGGSKMGSGRVYVIKPAALAALASHANIS